jgi:uncharacterized membrane protein
MHVAPWFWFAAAVLIAWGTVGIFQKLSTNYISAETTLVWLMVGFVVLEFFLYPGKGMFHYSRHSIAYGLLSGLLSTLGAWGLFAAMEYGGKASIVTPFSALYPLIVVMLSPLRQRAELFRTPNCPFFSGQFGGGSRARDG